MMPSRREVLSVSVLALLAGCLDDGTPTEDDDDEKSTSDENGTEDEPSEQEPDEEEQSNEYMVMDTWIIDNVPSSIDPVPSDDARVDGIGLFGELFEKLSDEEYDRGTIDSDYGEFERITLYESTTESDRIESTEAAYEELPEQSADELPTAPYLEHEDEIVAVVTLRIEREE